MKTCTRCGRERPIEEFPRRRGRPHPYSHCRDCAAEKQKLLRRRLGVRYLEYRREYRQRRGEELKIKTYARSKLNEAVKKGLVTKPPSCSQCGRSDRRVDGHHHDYSRPLEVEWLCRPCHAGSHVVIW